MHEPLISHLEEILQKRLAPQQQAAVDAHLSDVRTAGMSCRQ